MKLNWKVGSGFFATFAAAGYVGYLTGTSRECFNGTIQCHPDWQAVGALASAAAVVVALYLATKTAFREDAAKRKDREDFTQNVKFMVLSEATTLGRAITGFYELYEEHRGSKKMLALDPKKVFAGSSYYLYEARPIIALLGAQAAALPAGVFKDMSIGEARLKMQTKKMQKMLEKPSVEVDVFLDVTDHLREICTSYICVLREMQRPTVLNMETFKSILIETEGILQEDRQ